MKLLKLIKLFVLRNMKEEKFLTFLSIIGIALGVGLFMGVKVASDRAIVSFEADLRGAGLGANYEILDISGIDFEENIYPAVRRIEEQALPISRTKGYLPERKKTISIEGIYTAKAIESLSSDPMGRYDMESFFRRGNGILITKKLSETFSLKKGDVVHPLVYNRRYALKVVDILDGRFLPADTVIMDLGNFQDYFGRTGYLSAIDLVTDERKAAEIQKVLPPHLFIEKKEELIRNRRSLLKSFRYNLQFVSLIAVLAGLFLLYNTVFISVVKRRTEIGILRGLGVDRKTVVSLFMIQGLVLGLGGSVAGLLFGQAAASFSALAVEKTISSMYAALSISDYAVTGKDVLLGLVMGVSVSLIASAVPALEASRTRPNEGIKEGSFEGKYRRYLKIFSLAGLLATAAGGTLSYIDYRSMPFDFPFLAYAGILLIIAGFTFISPFYLSTILGSTKKVTGTMFGATGKVASADMRGYLYRFSVALMSVAISSALIIALFTLVFSFRSSLQGWIRKNISADVYIKPESCRSNFCFSPLPEEMLKAVENMPEVAALDKFRALSLDFRGSKVVAGFGQREMGAGRPGEVGKRNEKIVGRSNEIGISRYLSIKYGIGKGDSIELLTPKGPERFIVRDVFSSYSTTSGFIYLDRERLKSSWGLDDATQLGIYLKKGVDADKFIRDLDERFSGVYAMEIMNNEELRRKVLGIFDKTFSITYAIELISIVVSLIGVINTLLALVLERKREISIMRYLGGSWKQIAQVLVLSAGIVGMSGIFFGTLLGFLMSVIFIGVVNKVSFGWDIQFRMPVLSLIAVMVGLFSITLASGLIPAKVAKRIDPKRFISFE